MSLADAALELHGAGLCVLPAVRRSKRPALRSWKDYQSRLPSGEELLGWFGQERSDGALCVVCGAVSGNLEMIDFDLAGEAFEPWRDAVEARAPGLVDRLFVESTPSGGRHVAYRCEAPVTGNAKLAHRVLEVAAPEPIDVGGKQHTPRRADGRWIVTPTLIETRGEAGLFLCAPSEGYALERGSLTTLPLLTAQERELLLECARALDEVGVAQPALAADAEPPEPAGEEHAAAVATLHAHAAPARGPADAEARAVAYLARMPEAVSGQNGHGATYAAATALVHGFALEPARALALLLAHYNPRCVPPWSERELQHKVDDAASKAHDRPRGWLLDAPPPAREAPRADTSGIMAQGAAGGGPADRGWAPFPVHTLPEPFAEYVAESAAAIDCDPCMVAVPLLAVLAAAIGNTRRIELKAGWSEPPIVWALVAAPSGMAKNPALRAASRFVCERQTLMVREHEEARRKYASDRLVHEKTIAAWRRSSRAADDQDPESLPPAEPVAPVLPCAWTSDATVEAVGKLLQQNPRGILMLQDELKAFLSFDTYKSSKGADAPRFLGMHGGDQIRVDRKTSDPIIVRSAAMSIAGMIQPSILARSLDRESRENGLAARFLMAMPQWRVKRWNENIVDAATVEDARAAYQSLCSLRFHRNQDGDEVPLSVPMSPEAKRLWERFADEHADELEAIGAGSELTSVWPKHEGYAARLALVFAMVRDVRQSSRPLFPLVDAQSMADAIELVRWFGEESRRIYPALSRGGNPEVAEEPVQRELRELASWIAARGGRTTGRELQRGIRRYSASADAARAALGRLVAAGLAEWVYAPGGSAGHPERLCCLTGGGIKP